MVYFLENNNFPRFQRGPTFYAVGWRGSNFFTGGRGSVQMLISVETYRNCDFPGPLIPPLDLRMFCLHL